MIMIPNILKSNIIGFFDLYRVFQYLVGGVLVIGCWHHVKSQLVALILLFGLLFYQIIILVLTFKKYLLLNHKNTWALIFFIDGAITGIGVYFCEVNTVLAFSIFALFLLIYIEALGFKSFLAISGLIGTVLICNLASLKVYKHDNFCGLSHLCESAIYVLIFTFFLLYTLLKSRFYQVLRNDLDQQSTVNRKLKSDIFSLSKYLSPSLTKSIIAGDTAQVDATDKDLAIFFSDMQGFSKLSDEISIEKLSWLINSYLNEMTEIVFRFGGTLDKVIGDSIMVFFGDPSSRGAKKDAVSCICMALAMKESMANLKKRWFEAGIKNPPSIRMGINTGNCRVGNFGTKTKLNYTVMGNTVNLASYLESIAEPNEILISENTYTLVKDQFHFTKKEPENSQWLTKKLNLYAVDKFIPNTNI